ncbi:hypothetical protein G7046_g3796 [Stylonectria norvegica]|nr:hypothetical protein G7046_g3796 [Stylonectria norvegica]
MKDEVVYMRPEQGDDPDIDYVDSRRIVINSLPVWLTYRQALDGIQGEGGVLNITFVDTKNVCYPGRKSAVVEFDNAEAARTYVAFTMKKPIFFAGPHGFNYPAEVSMILTKTFTRNDFIEGLRVVDATGLKAGRSIVIAHFPKEAVWYFLCMIDHQFIVRVHYNKSTIPGVHGNLGLELTSLFQATRVRNMLRNGLVGVYKLSEVNVIYNIENPSDQFTQDLYTMKGNLIPFVEVDHLAKEWNNAPFNMHWPTAPMTQNPSQYLIPRKPAPKATHKELLAEDLSTTVEELDNAPEIEIYKSFRATEYRIVGSAIQISRRAKGWSIAMEDEIKLLMANTLTNPAWADFWDGHFECSKTTNLRKMNEYGELAQHRRQVAAKKGVDPSTNPQCGKSWCKWCNVDRKEVPRVVTNWLNNTEEPVSSNTNKLPF